MHLLDELVTAPIGTLRTAGPHFARLASSGLGCAVEYELLRRHVRRELPPLAEHSAAPAVVSLSTLLDGFSAPPDLGLYITTLDIVRIPDALGLDPSWTAFRKRLELSARDCGFGPTLSAGMAGAVGELADNVVRHSQSAGPRVAGFSCNPGLFEYVVGDVGIGMLASLRRAPEFRSLADDLEALPLAVTPGVSRLGRDVGYGYGYRAVFAPLSAANGTVRLRSGAAVLTMAGVGPTFDRGVCAQRPHQQGVTVTVRVSLA